MNEVVSQLRLQQSVSKVHPAPVGAPEAPPHVASHVPHEPLQQSASLAHPAPSGAPLGPPHVLSQVPHAPPQQSESLAQLAPAPAQPHVPLAQTPLQQSLAVAQPAPSCAPSCPPQVLSHVPHVSAPQQSLDVEHESPELPHGLPHWPLLHTRMPQQSLLLVQASPVPRQPQVPLPLHTLGAQQSLLDEQAVPEPAQPHVDVPVSQLSAPQQSALLWQPCPPEAQPHVPFTQRPEQHSLALAQLVPSSLHDVVPPSPPEPGS